MTSAQSKGRVILMAKQVKVTVDGVSHYVANARLWVSDSGGNFNHPEMRLTVMPSGESYDPERAWRGITINLQWQRNRLLSNDIGTSVPAAEWLDTAMAWSACYAGKLTLEIGASGRYELSAEDKVRLAVMRKIQSNIQHGACECLQLVKALQHLGAHVEMLYVRNGGGVIPLLCLDGAGAASRYARVGEGLRAVG